MFGSVLERLEAFECVWSALGAYGRLGRLVGIISYVCMVCMTCMYVNIVTKNKDFDRSTFWERLYVSGNVWECFATS